MCAHDQTYEGKRDSRLSYIFVAHRFILESTNMIFTRDGQTSYFHWQRRQLLGCKSWDLLLLKVIAGYQSGMLV